MNIPTPATGHWTKVQHGKSATKAPLPEANSETRLSWKVDLPNSQNQRQVSKFAPTREKKETFPEIPIAKDLKNLHLLVKQTRSHLKEGWDRTGWQERSIASHLDVQVSESSLDRVLLFLDALVRGLHDRGFKVTSDYDNPKKRKALREPDWQRQEQITSCCWVQWCDERLRFRLREKNKRVPIPEEKKVFRFSPDWEEVPSGQLVFTIEEGSGFKTQTLWQDGKIQIIEKFLGEIITTFGTIAKQIKERRIRWEEEDRRRAEIEAVRQHHRHQRWREEELVKKMLQFAKDHEKAEILRRFLSNCRSKVVEAKKVPPGDSSWTDLWFRWMETRADMIDPLEAEPMPWETKEFEHIIRPTLGVNR